LTTLFYKEANGPLGAYTEDTLNLDNSIKEKAETDDDNLTGISIGDGLDIDLKIKDGTEPKEDKGSWEYELTLKDDDAGDATYVIKVEADGKTTFGQKVDDENIDVSPVKVTLTADRFGKGIFEVDADDIDKKTNKVYLKGSRVSLLAQDSDDDKYEFHHWIEEAKRINGLDKTNEQTKLITLHEDIDVIARFAFKADGPLGKEDTIELDFSGNKEETKINYDDGDGKISGISIGDEFGIILNINGIPKESNGSWEYELKLSGNDAGDATYIVKIDKEGTRKGSQRLGKEEVIN